jgi:urease accessory protein
VKVIRRNSRTVIDDLRSEPPVSLRETAAGLAVVGSAAGPVGGDDLMMSVDVGVGATLRVEGVAASMVWPGPTGMPSRQGLHLRVDRGGHLEWIGQPVLVVQQAHHIQETIIELGPEATLEFHDEVALGRSGELPGRLDARLRVVRDGVVLIDQHQIHDPNDPGWSTSAGAGGLRHILHHLVIGQESEPVATTVSPDRACARFPVGADAELSISLGADGIAARRPD